MCGLSLAGTWLWDDLGLGEGKLDWFVRVRERDD